MDRKLSKHEIRQRQLRSWLKIGTGIAFAATIIILISVLLSPSVKREDLVFDTVDTGSIETSITAIGKVIPSFEEMINSPITSRILEVYCKPGDSIKEDTPLLKLDLQSTENSYKKLLNEEKVKQYNYEQFTINNETKLSNMKMQLKTAEMRLKRMKVELENEYYMDSLGAQSTDKVRQAEINYQVAAIEFEQQQLQYANE